MEFNICHVSPFFAKFWVYWQWRLWWLTVDELLISYPELQPHLAFNGRIVKSPIFEPALSKNINLKPCEQRKTKYFEGFCRRSGWNNRWSATISGDRALAKKKKDKCRIWNLKRIPPTFNIAERLFSKVKHEFTDFLKSLLPVNSESQFFLSVNCDFWSVHTVNSLV